MRLLSTIIAAWAALLLCTQVGNAAVTTGDKAPAFTATTASGETVSLADYAGKTVVLEWTNKGCPFVKKFYESGKMQSLQKTATDDGVVWLSVISSAPGKQGHMGGEEAVAHAKDVNASPSAIILDPQGTLGKQYGAKTTPHIFIINAAGELVYQGAPDNIASPSQDDLAKATNYVTATLAALKAGTPIEVSTTQPYGCSVKYYSHSF